MQEQHRRVSGDDLSPYRTSVSEINIILSVIFCIFTFGLYYFFWQYQQFKQCNTLLGEDEHGFMKWLFLSFITFGIYHFYHEYKFSQDIIVLQERFGLKVNGPEYPIICLVVSFMGFFLLIDMVHQDELNKIVNKYNNS